MAASYDIYRNYDPTDTESASNFGPLPPITDIDTGSPDGIADWSRDNYDFLGWNDSRDGSGNMYQPGETPAAYSLFAIWEEAVVIPDVTISYNGNTIASLSDSGTEVLETSGKLCGDDITIDYTKPTPNLQSKTVSPSTISDRTITADSGYDGLSQVTVNAIAPTKAAQTYTPTTTNYIIRSGRWLTGDQTIKGDANLVASNIKKDVQIFGVTGSYEGSGGGGGDTVVDFIKNHGTITSFKHSSVTKIGQGAFAYCFSLQTVSFPACTSIGNSAFYACSNLTAVSFPSCTSIGTGAFYTCSKLTAVSFPSCPSIGNSAFAFCFSLQTVSFPACTSIGSGAFYACSNLTAVSFPSCTSIRNYAFCRCVKLLSLYFTGSGVISLAHSNAFSSTPIAGYTTSTGGVYGSIYVPSSLLASYKTATNWTYFSNRFVGI